jgi:hypothetical protein
MSDKQWTRDSFDVLLEDGTEFLGVAVSYADRIAWAKFAAERKESGAGDWRVDTAGTLWCALRRTGLIAQSFTWPSFWPQIADWDKVDIERVDPTGQASGSGSPAN